MQVIVIMILLVASFLKPPGLAQEPDQPTKLGNLITKRQVLELPRTDAAPRITLQRALRIAESFIKKRKVDISTCYLFEARLISGERDEELRWRLLWISVGRDSASSKDVRIAVTMDGKAHLE